MERESFENDEIAALMNQLFVSIKVDREERPDVDQIYMQAVQAMTGRGGWPMTVFLTPDGVPFYGGTYFPPVDRHGMPAFPHPHEIDRARLILERNGRTSQDYFKARPDKSFFYSLDGENFVAYRVGGNFAVGLGD